MLHVELKDCIEEDKCNTLSHSFVIHIMTLTVRLPEPVESQLSRFCETMGMSKSQVVQTALKAWFAKPSADSVHPLLAYAQAASRAAPATNWAGPYSKERLRARVLASGAVPGVSEPETAYAVIPTQPAVRRKAAAKNAKSNSVSRSKNKGEEAISLTNKPDATHGTGAS